MVICMRVLMDKGSSAGTEMTMYIRRQGKHMVAVIVVPVLIRLKICKMQPRFVSETPFPLEFRFTTAASVD